FLGDDRNVSFADEQNINIFLFLTSTAIFSTACLLLWQTVSSRRRNCGNPCGKWRAREDSNS
ncbi:MAG: hypothetical protein K2X53_06705, partial [Alphaproteobacteria bacterium]|nr:hypothetical protein [Alphaproteobacteria bacterium]